MHHQCSCHTLVGVARVFGRRCILSGIDAVAVAATAAAAAAAATAIPRDSVHVQSLHTANSAFHLDPYLQRFDFLPQCFVTLFQILDKFNSFEKDCAFAIVDIFERRYDIRQFFETRSNGASSFLL